MKRLSNVVCLQILQDFWFRRVFIDKIQPSLSDKADIAQLLFWKISCKPYVWYAFRWNCFFQTKTPALSLFLLTILVFLLYNVAVSFKMRRKCCYTAPSYQIGFMVCLFLFIICFPAFLLVSSNSPIVKNLEYRDITAKILPFTDN